eukprot:EG_transcript_24080
MPQAPPPPHGCPAGQVCSAAPGWGVPAVSWLQLMALGGAAPTFPKPKRRVLNLSPCLRPAGLSPPVPPVNPILGEGRTPLQDHQALCPSRSSVKCLRLRCRQEHSTCPPLPL